MMKKNCECEALGQAYLRHVEEITKLRAQLENVRLYLGERQWAWLFRGDRQTGPDPSEADEIFGQRALHDIYDGGL